MEFLNNRPTYQKMLGGVFIIDICCCALLLANLLDNPSTPINAFMGLVSYSLTVVAIIFMQLISCVLNLFGSYLHVTEARSSSTKRAAILSLATLTIAFLIILLRGAPERFAAMRSVEIATKTGLALTMSISHIAFVFALKQDQFRFRLDRRHMLDFILFLSVAIVGTCFLFDTLPYSKSIRCLGLILVALWRANVLRLVLLPN